MSEKYMRYYRDAKSKPTDTPPIYLSEEFLRFPDARQVLLHREVSAFILYAVHSMGQGISKTHLELLTWTDWVINGGYKDQGLMYQKLAAIPLIEVDFPQEKPKKT